eukprot:SAG31_NODE_313_length_17858_cov_34.811307_11_plen_212_part_00
MYVDTSRHFLSVPTLEKTITAMSISKMNVLHLHIVDGGGWPLCINSTRTICEQEAYQDPWGAPATYTEAQLRHLVGFATARGVRVMPEFDLPGHIAGPLCRAEPTLCVANGCAPDPSSEKWWDWLTSVVGELTNIFPEQYFHGGADEFHPDCWLENTELKVWAAAHNIGTAEELLDYFHTRWQTIILNAGRKPQFCACATLLAVRQLIRFC